MTPPLKSRTTGTDWMPKRLRSHDAWLVSTCATLMRGRPFASREAASVVETRCQFCCTLWHRATASLQKSTSQSPEVAPVAACARCSKFCSVRSMTSAPNASSSAIAVASSSSCA